MQIMSYYNRLINEDTKERLAVHGLTATIDIDEDAGSPRGWTNSVFVGADTRMRGDIEMGNNFADYVSNYCKEVLDCHESDIVWQPVYKFSHSGVSYSTTSFNDRWDSGTFGFIFQTKESIREEFCVKRVTKSIIAQVKNNLSGEIETYSHWANGDVYSLHIENDSGSIDEYCGWLVDEGDYINNMINEMIDSCCGGVDRESSSYTLYITADSEVATGQGIIRYFNEQLDELFGFTLTTGVIKQFNKDSEVMTNVSFNSMPSVFQIADRYNGNLLQEISVKADEIHKNRMVTNNEEGEGFLFSFLIEATNGNTYADWSLPLLDALFELIVENIEGLGIGTRK